MRTVEEHQQFVADLIRTRDGVRTALPDALGLTLAEDVAAPIPLPVFDNSAMDGYAVRAADLADAGAANPVKLPVAEDIPAGRTDQLVLSPGSAHRIMTGAPVPDGADAIVPVEQTDGGKPGAAVQIRVAPRPGQHVRRAGEDVTVGTTVLRAGHVLTPAALGLAAALGLTGLTVRPRLRVLVVSTGSELVQPGTELRPGQIYESNAVMVAAAVREAGGTVVGTATAADDVAAFRTLLADRAGGADLILTSGGVSAGAYEVVKDAFAGTDVEFTKVAMQPGMPQGAGTVAISGEAGEFSTVPIITLPGNPVSALVSFEVFIRPALRTAMGLSPHRPRRTAVLTEDLTSPAGKRQFRRGVYDPATGTVSSYGPAGSHHLRFLASANCLLEIGEQVTDLAAGDQVAVWDLS